MAGEEREFGNRVTAIAIVMVNVIVQTVMCAIIVGNRVIAIATPMGSVIVRIAMYAVTVMTVMIVGMIAIGN